MEISQPQCDCHKGTLSKYCIHEGCQLDRRLCAICKQNHNSHQIIQMNCLQSIYKTNVNLPNGQYKASLETAIHIAQDVKNKLILDVNSIIDNEYKKWISNQLNLLIKTTEDQEQKQKSDAIKNPDTKKQQLQNIAWELRSLSRADVRNFQFIREMCNRLNQNFKYIREAVKQQLQQLRIAIAKQMERLSPFSNTTQKDVYDALQKQRKKGQEIENERKKQSEQERGSFLIKNGKVIGFNNSLLGPEQWTSRSKLLEEVQKLEVRNKNLTEVPFQLGFFPNVSAVRLNQNQITKISNFSNMDILQHLELDENQIEKIQNLSPLINLKVLSLDSNKIQKMEGLSFLIQLKLLSLNGNLIERIEDLDQLKNLETLSLQRNKIQKFQGLNNLKKLSKLNIRQNRLKKIENLEQLINLKQLSLNQNPLKKKNEGLRLVDKLLERGVNITGIPLKWGYYKIGDYKQLQYE